ncbi:MAG: response regulator transcription factor [bacterium]|nr:response regulator transcription factor [bacterium]
MNDTDESPERSQSTFGKQIFVIDSHHTVIMGLKWLLGDQGMYVSGESSPTAAIDALNNNSRKPDLLIIEIKSYNEQNGFEVFEKLLSLFPTVPILIFTVCDEKLFASRVYEAGGLGYLSKATRLEDIVSSVRSILQGGTAFSQSVTSSLITGIGKRQNGGRRGKLSKREQEVFHLLGGGMGTREIAQQLGLSFKTIESHRAHIKDKLQLPDGTELIRRAVVEHTNIKVSI